MKEAPAFSLRRLRAAALHRSGKAGGWAPSGTLGATSSSEEITAVRFGDIWPLSLPAFRKRGLAFVEGRDTCPPPRGAHKGGVCQPVSPPDEDAGPTGGLAVLRFRLGTRGRGWTGLNRDTFDATVDASGSGVDRHVLFREAAPVVRFVVNIVGFKVRMEPRFCIRLEFRDTNLDFDWPWKLTCSLGGWTWFPNDGSIKTQQLVAIEADNGGWIVYIYILSEASLSF